MAKSKTKQSKKAQPSEPIAAVKKAGVTKPAQTPKSKSKEMAKSAAKKLVKETKKKAAKAESSDDSSEEDSSDSDSEEVKKPAAKANGKVKAESSDSESDSDSDEAETKAKTNGAKVNGSAKAAAAATAASSDSSDSDSDEESDDKKPSAVKAADSDDSEDDSDDSDDSEDDSDGSSSESAEAAPASKKRKADSEIDATPKKAKTENAEAASTLFVGSLSWGTDDSALWEAFKDFEGLVNARVVTDKMSGKSRGFGYVDFSDSDAASKAYEAMQGHELDGRTLNLDYANARSTDANPRDRAADRAKKHGDSISPESDTLFVGNLPFGVDQDSVREFFAASREVASVRLPTDPETGNLKGFGYVSFNSVEDAKGALQELNGASIGEGRSARSVRLDYASSRPPPREGGGFGGGRGGGRGFGGGRGGGRGRGGDRGRGRGRGGGRGGPRGGAGYSGTKISFD
ncbi:RNA recognition motif domain-containing protein [Hirsutella rhossiliensis]|uniref:RNA recognition motif domain-containing protein n=1 Tax=Hirsutella rhossiliensis TaxID=111463 RepID=A0A9P8N403_9HYPO|nr:RNA recognition motif domain-containing protein [Hirsutella rhossiliensis]KAH0967228.1 RNA recognition motif domain-containing protein [Hirsutella rhossiliensis]